MKHICDIDGFMNAVSNDFIPDSAKLYVKYNEEKPTVPASGITIKYDAELPDCTEFVIETVDHAISFTVEDTIIAHKSLNDKYVVTVGDVRSIWRAMKSQNIVFEDDNDYLDCGFYVSAAADEKPDTDGETKNHEIADYAYDELVNTLMLYADDNNWVPSFTMEAAKHICDVIKGSVSDDDKKLIDKLNIKDEVSALKKAIKK